MRKLFALLLALTISFFFLTPAKACEPCYQILTLEETAEVADLIVIGKLARQGPSTGDFPHGGPDWIEVQVLEVLKGEPRAKKIRANSWDGMCAYGILLPDEREYLIFLAEGEEYYKAVEIGCAAKQYPVDDEMVLLEEEIVPLDELVARLGLERRAVDEDGGALPVCSWLGFGVVLVGVVLVRKRE